MFLSEFSGETENEKPRLSLFYVKKMRIFPVFRTKTALLGGESIAFVMQYLCFHHAISMLLHRDLSGKFFKIRYIIVIQTVIKNSENRIFATAFAFRDFQMLKSGVSE